VCALLGRELGYDVVELNASDARSKLKSLGVSSQAICSGSGGGGGGGSGGGSGRGGLGASAHRLLIMDEVDGMGGMADLIKVILTSKIPVICICNDRQRCRALQAHCYDLRMRRPSKLLIAHRLVAIGLQEGLALDLPGAELLAEQCGIDIRQAINAMQMWGADSTSRGMSHAQVRAALPRIQKDKVLRLTPLDACRNILCRHGTLSDRIDAFFLHTSLLPLLLQQNYIAASKSGVFRSDSSEKSGLCTDIGQMRLSQAADALSESDLAAAQIHQEMHW
jgi:replication factor C subunit 1